MKRMLLVLALSACSSPTPEPAAPVPHAPEAPPPSATGVLQLGTHDDDLGGGLTGTDLGSAFGAGLARDPTGPRTLSSCFPTTLDGLAHLPAPAGFGDDLFARAYLERRAGGRSINVNVWDAAQNDIASELTQFPVLGHDHAERTGAGITRTGGHHEGHESELDWEELSGGEHRDGFTVRVSDTRLVSVRVQPSAQGDAARIFGTLDLACLESAALR